MNRKLLASAIGASLLVAGTAYAQVTPAPQDAQSNPQTLSTITVTGTHIREAQIDTAQPVVTVTAAEIQKQGLNNVADILQNLTISGAPPISRSSVLASGENVGGYYVNLRNLGASRTLVLLNGHRMGTTTSGLTDLQQIPVSAIDRVEILKDGASAIYGSDAIAGVVNIITKNRFNGAEASVYAGQYDEGDGTSQTESFTLGASTDKSSVMMTFEYSKDDPVWAKDRWFSRYGGTIYHPTAGSSIVSQYGAFFNYNPYTGDQYDLCGDTAGLCTPNHAGGDTYSPSYMHPTGSADRANPNQQMMLTTGLQRKSVFVSGTHDFTDHLHFQTDILYNRRDTTAQVAGYPFQPAFILPGQSQYVQLSPDSYFNPIGNGPLSTGADQPVIFYRRGWEMPRVTQSALTTFRVGAQLSGDFDILGKNWTWDVGAINNKNNSLKTSQGDFNLVNTSQALGPSYFNAGTGRVECGTADSPIPFGTAPGSCVPWNPLIPAGVVGDGSLTGNKDLQQYLFSIYHDTGITRSKDYYADISGSVFSLPAGDLAVAAGVEYRDESGSFVPDEFEQDALSTNLASGPTGGAYNVKEAYLEVAVPILKDLPGAKELSLDLAIRHSKYNTFGSTNNPKFSLTWRPIQDLLVRGTYAKGFRAPQIADLFGGISGTFDYYTDPCDIRQQAGSNPAVAQRCQTGFGGQTPVPANYEQIGQGGVVCDSFPCQTGIQNFAGSNPNLGPETATSKTAGMVYSPTFSWLPGRLDLSLDWYNIKINNVISGDTITAQLDDCYVLGVASRCSSSLFTRNASGVVDYELRGERNIGWLETEGWDFGFHYVLPQFSVGTFGVTWNTTYISKDKSRIDFQPTTPVTEDIGWGSEFRIRSNATLNWQKGPFGADWTVRYYSSWRETCSFTGPIDCNMPDYIDPQGIASATERNGATTFHDVSFHYMTPWNSTVSVGVNNVFDHWARPSYADLSSQFAYYGGFDIGRFYWIRYNQKF